MNTQMQQRQLAPEDILNGYDAVSQLYSHIPPLLIWRAWEYAVYQRFRLPEPVLDIGCGDGRYFRLVWPHIRDVVGVDQDPAVVALARRSGVYSEVYETPAHVLPTACEGFASAFANCALEHMDHLDEVLSSIYHSLRPGGTFLFSVVTDKFLDWTTLPLLVEQIGEPTLARVLQDGYTDYHHLVNPLAPEVWGQHLASAGFEVSEYIPIVPEMTSRLFLLLDQLWHVRRAEGELGNKMHAYIRQIANFPQALRQVVAGFLEMERDWSIGSGTVFLARRRVNNESMATAPPSVATDPVPTTPCWCGNTYLERFSTDYVRCSACETLHAAGVQQPMITKVVDDERDFYGRRYWFEHQENDLGFANITIRSRVDLPERCLHWLRTVLKHKLPRGYVLDIGSGHGGFVAMLRLAGFAATGLELSPSIAEYARQTFDIPMLCGPIEDQQIAPGSLDAIVLMDVLEHLPDPVQTMRRCLELLKPAGLLFIQTPQYPENATYEDMAARGTPFLEMLKADEHLHLFSRQSIRELFRRLGVEHLEFETAIFAHYDMFLVASRAPLAANAPDAIAGSLSTMPQGRMVLALLDLDDQFHALKQRYAEAEADRAARLEVIERQGQKLGRIAALEADVAYLKDQLAASEADRAARLEVIEHQGAQLSQARDRLAQVEQQIELACQTLSDTRTGALLNIARPARWQHLQRTLHEIVVLSRWNGHQQPGDGRGASQSLDDYIAEIDRYNRARPDMELMNAVRAHNHHMVEELNKLRPLRGRRLLDIGASPHGYALERALQLGVAEYVGIGLGIQQSIEVHTTGSYGRMLPMNAVQLDFEDASFDLVISISTFEHIDNIAAALQEIRRVLKTGGSALISFEPIWTCSYGHHLHHFGPVSWLVPDWAHLAWDKQQMLRELAPVWPADAPLTLEDAAHWVYESTEINRIGIVQMRELFANCGLAIEWLVPLTDEARDVKRLHEVAEVVALAPDELMIKGLSMLLNKI